MLQEKVPTHFSVTFLWIPVVDPGFPVGGRRPRYDSKILYVETKESGPLGGRAPARPPPPDPPMDSKGTM